MNDATHLRTGAALRSRSSSCRECSGNSFKKRKVAAFVYLTPERGSVYGASNPVKSQYFFGGRLDGAASILLSAYC